MKVFIVGELSSFKQNKPFRNISRNVEPNIVFVIGNLTKLL
jgi:hypothetical protein